MLQMNSILLHLVRVFSVQQNTSAKGIYKIVCYKVYTFIFDMSDLAGSPSYTCKKNVHH